MVLLLVKDIVASWRWVHSPDVGAVRRGLVVTDHTVLFFFFKLSPLLLLFSFMLINKKLYILRLFASSPEAQYQNSEHANTT